MRGYQTTAFLDLTQNRRIFETCDMFRIDAKFKFDLDLLLGHLVPLRELLSQRCKRCSDTNY